MKIIIPMSGRGQRFKNAGYQDPKPLIKVDGIPIIHHVLDLFPGENDVVCICAKDHLENTQMEQVIRSKRDSAKIVAIDPHKFGPVYAVSKLFDQIQNEEEVIVNYCDFGTYWDYSEFLKHTRRRNADGAIPSYKGFHPHMLADNNYAFIRDEDQWMLEIQEKMPFTDNKMAEYASNGTYYFKKGSHVKKYFKQLMEQNIQVGGEYYVSMVFNLLAQDNLRVSIYEIQHMLQWGTPSDLEEYLHWSKLFSDLSKQKRSSDVNQSLSNIVPMAGQGKRFQDEGYTNPKPLIQVSGHPMITQATRSMPPAKQNIFICQKSHLEKFPISSTLKEHFSNSTFQSIDKLTEGQACTCEIGVKAIEKDSALFIGACDNGMLYDHSQFEDLISVHDPDVVAFTFVGHPLAKKYPQMYGWVEQKDTKAIKVKVKEAISDTPEKDHGIVGSFYFKSKEIFETCLDRLYKTNSRVNNEFYVDSMVQMAIDLNLNVRVFQIDQYICWGTPNDLKTFNYWQSFFHKVDWHPYSISTDQMVKNESKDLLIKQSHDFAQANA